MYERQKETIMVGDALAYLEPTAGLRWHNGVLEQWFEARAAQTNGAVFIQGKWCPVPNEE